MKRLPVALALVLFLFGNITALAQDDDDDEGHDFLEVAVFGGISIPSGKLSNWQDSLGTKTGFGVGFDIGAFVSSKLVLGVNFTYSQFGIDTNGPASTLNHRFFNPSLYLKYYFWGDGNLAPFIKVHAGIDNPKFATFVQDANASTPGKFRELSYDPAFAYGGGAGLFYYTSDYSGLYLEANYHYGLTDETTGDFQGREYLFGVKTGLIDIHAGITVFFGDSE